MDRTNTPRGFNAIPDDQAGEVACPVSADPPCLAAALAYLRLGWSPIPLCPADHSGPLPPRHCGTCSRPGKTPPFKWKEYQDAYATADQVRAWWKQNPTFNVGLALGPLSGLVAFDVDDDSGEDELARLFKGAIPLTMGFTSGRGGRRLFFRMPKNRTFPRSALKLNGKGLDVLSTGSQTVMPPSIHASGRLYAWTRGYDPAHPSVEVLSPDVLDAIESARGKRSQPGGGARGPELLVSDQARQLLRARADVLTWEPCITGEGGHKRIFAKGCRLIHGYGLSVDAALALMTEGWNQRCNPPWSDGDLRHHLEGARDRGSHDPIPEKPPATRPTGGGCEPVATGSVRNVSGASDNTHVGRDQANPPEPPPPANRQTTRPTTETAGDGPPRGGVPFGRPASQLIRRNVEWFVPPYVPRGMLTLVVGQPTTGKSTFVAYLLSKSKRPVLLPGHEEDPGVMLIPRLVAHGVNLDNVLVLDNGDWGMPGARERLAKFVREWKADLVVADPIDSYMAEGFSENDGQHVRTFLESFAWIAKETGAAVVGVRHPGKDPNNVLVGSRQWRAVPRSVVELLIDQGPPLRRIVRPYKDSLGQEAPARYFDLVGNPGQPRVFRLGSEVHPALVEAAKEVPDRMERSKIDQAVELLKRLLAQGEVESRAVYAAGEGERIKDRTLGYAAERLKVKTRRDGFGPAQRCYWSLPTEGQQVDQE